MSHWGHRSGKAEADCTYNPFSLLCAPWFLSSSFSSFSPAQSLSSPPLPNCLPGTDQKYFYPAELRIKQFPIILQWPSKNLFYTDEQNKKVLEKGTARAPGTEAQSALGSFSHLRGCDWEPPPPAASLPCLESPVPKALLWHMGVGMPLGSRTKAENI